MSDGDLSIGAAAAMIVAGFGAGVLRARGESVPYKLEFVDTALWKPTVIPDSVMLEASRLYLAVFGDLQLMGEQNNGNWFHIPAPFPPGCLTLGPCKILMDTLRKNSTLEGSTEFEEIQLRLEARKAGDKYPTFYEMAQAKDGTITGRIRLNTASSSDVSSRYHIDHPRDGSFSSLKQAVWITTSWSIKKVARGPLFFPTFHEDHRGTMVLQDRAVRFRRNKPIQGETIFGRPPGAEMITGRGDDDKRAAHTVRGQITRAYLAPHRAPDELADDEIRILVAGLTGKGAVHVLIKDTETGKQIATNLDEGHGANRGIALRKGVRKWAYQ